MSFLIWKTRFFGLLNTNSANIAERKQKWRHGKFLVKATVHRFVWIKMYFSFYVHTCIPFQRKVTFKPGRRGQEMRQDLSFARRAVGSCLFLSASKCRTLYAPLCLYRLSPRDNETTVFSLADRSWDCKAFSRCKHEPAIGRRAVHEEY